jgi:hypothetical protein
VPVVTRVIVAEGCREVDSPVTGQRYYARGGAKGYMQGGSFDMDPSDARLAVRMGGALASEAGTTRRSLGFRCVTCGFGSFLRTCSRCGGRCDRE